MQQQQKKAPIPSKPQATANAKPAKSAAPVALDEKALRQIAGGVTRGPNGGW